MKWRHAFLFFFTALGSSAWAESLQPLTEAEMGDISGQNAIELSLKLHNNIELKNDLHEGLAHCYSPGSYNPCRLALEFAGHEGYWLVMKEFYGYLQLDGIRLEANTLPTANTAYHDEDRFKRIDGQCMVEHCDPGGLAYIDMSYPDNKGPGQYLDMQTFMNVGRMSVEQDEAGVPGYLLENQTGVANAFRISDSSGPNANHQVRFDGRALIYGF
ncbi:hypothetical protein K8B33_06240 [Alcanivorax sp. JB21]|uniref:hypothetical protein n=1 Tax=Alcanivorax limicola TaxID=2874102 RepID=UPI001CC177CA|nr:hypothetical protein [Alcanivorax limicola]MBZ2188686.1 hypothetical protein [Alcanivorax limicola]